MGVRGGQVLANDFSPEAAGAVMRRLSKLSARFIGEHGFSIGVDDVTSAQRLLAEKRATINTSYLECQVCSFFQIHPLWHFIMTRIILGWISSLCVHHDCQYDVRGLCLQSAP